MHGDHIQHLLLSYLQDRSQHIRQKLRVVVVFSYSRRSDEPGPGPQETKPARKHGKVVFTSPRSFAGFCCICMGSQGKIDPPQCKT